MPYGVVEHGVFFDEGGCDGCVVLFDEVAVKVTDEGELGVGFLGRGVSRREVIVLVGSCRCNPRGLGSVSAFIIDEGVGCGVVRRTCSRRVGGSEP